MSGWVRMARAVAPASVGPEWHLEGDQTEGGSRRTECGQVFGREISLDRRPVQAELERRCPTCVTVFERDIQLPAGAA